jgi:tRNA-splicing ligase RtcB
MKFYPTQNGMVKSWTEGVPVEDEAVDQIEAVANLPFVEPHVAVMPDVHVGMGATIGSVIPTYNAIIPAAVGVDIGCGMTAVHTRLTRAELRGVEDDLRRKIERAVPHGRTNNGGPGDRGAWHDVPALVEDTWLGVLHGRYLDITECTPNFAHKRPVNQLGTLGTGNHFIELCYDEHNDVWVMLHSGSRGPGARIASIAIRWAKQLMEQYFIDLPNKDLAYLVEDTNEFFLYVQAMEWALDYAATNRNLMLIRTLEAIGEDPELCHGAIDCHHNFAQIERHFGKNLWITRKGATRAGPGELGIIPGSMGAHSYIVEGLGNRDSFYSCAHGAGRTMSRTHAKQTITVKDHKADLAGTSCDDSGHTLDESPGAYKPISAVMAAQTELVKKVHRLKQFVVVKG